VEKHSDRLTSGKEMDIFTRAEWWIFRLTGLGLLALLAYKLLHAAFCSVF
jgi:hypothetical protein